MTPNMLTYMRQAHGFETDLSILTDAKRAREAAGLVLKVALHIAFAHQIQIVLGVKWLVGLSICGVQFVRLIDYFIRGLLFL